MEDDEEEAFIAEYEDGHWEWDDDKGMLAYKRDNISIEGSTTLAATVIGSMDFRDDLDLMEQQRFRKRFERQTGDDDVVILQDIRNLALFTAPKVTLTSSIINVLHLPATERFLRSLILYCQYFIQISDEMGKRSLELQVKIRTDLSDKVELEYQDNLRDLRILIAKEYSYVIQGDGGYTKYHHMGPKKKNKSLMKKELLFIESFLQFCIQIVWLSLGRLSYKQIELEIHRLFKSDAYNLIERHHGRNYNDDLSKEESRVLFGDCLKFTGGKLNRLSPLINEVNCERQIEYQLLGLGVVKFPRLNHRLRYFEQALIAPEESFRDLGVSLGILGYNRKRFDTVLKEIKIPAASTASSSATLKHSISRMTSSRSPRSSRVSAFSKLLTDIVIPEKDYVAYSETRLPEFPQESYFKRKVMDSIQRRKWLNYMERLAKTDSHRRCR